MKSLEEVAASLQGYDPQALRADTALQFLRTLVKPVEQTETVDLKSALGRVLAADVVSPIDVPAHDNSAMDGYAVRSSDVAKAPARLRPASVLRGAGELPHPEA